MSHLFFYCFNAKPSDIIINICADIDYKKGAKNSGFARKPEFNFFS